MSTLRTSIDSTTNPELVMPLEDRSDYLTPNNCTSKNRNVIYSSNTNITGCGSGGFSNRSERSTHKMESTCASMSGISTRPQLRLGHLHSGRSIRKSAMTLTESAPEEQFISANKKINSISSCNNNTNNNNNNNIVNNIASSGERDVKENVNTDRSSNECPRNIISTSNNRNVMCSDNLSAAIGAEFQRNLLQQQLEQLERYNRRLTTEIDEQSQQLSHITQNHNELKIANESLEHKYQVMSDKLSSCMAELHNVDNLLSRERQELCRIRDENDRLQSELRLQQKENERVSNLLVRAEAAKGLDETAVQRIMHDRRKYIPTEEVEHREHELLENIQSTTSHYEQVIKNVLTQVTQEETEYFVTRSAVMSASNELTTRLQRGERTLQHFQDQLHQLSQLDRATSEFILSIMNENKELHHELKCAVNELQFSQDDNGDGDDLDRLEEEQCNNYCGSDNKVERIRKKSKNKRRGAFSAQEHKLLQQKVEGLTDKLNKAQQLVSAQTTLAREHESEMQSLLCTNDELQDKLGKMTEELSRSIRATDEMHHSLECTQAELLHTKEELAQVQITLTEERHSSDVAIARLNSNNTSIQREYEQQIQTLTHEKNEAERELTQLRGNVEERTHLHEILHKELEAAKHEMHVYEISTSEALSSTTQIQLQALTKLRELLETQLAEWQHEVEECATRTRYATRTQQEMCSELAALRAGNASLETDLRLLREENSKQQESLVKAHNELRTIEGELTSVKAQRSESDSRLMELTAQLEIVQGQYEMLQTSLNGQCSERDERVVELQRALQTAEATRANLQDELATLRTRNEQLEKEVISHERNTNDKEQLMKENLRLHEQYQMTLNENNMLHEKLEAMHHRQINSEQIAKELMELQDKLKELPQLHTLVNEAKREARMAKDEVSALRAERDALASRLDKLIEENKHVQSNNADFDRIIHEAGAVVQRLGGQVMSAKQRQSAKVHKTDTADRERSEIKGVFANTRPTGQKTSFALGNDASASHHTSSPIVNSNVKAVHFSPLKKRVEWSETGESADKNNF